jgi:hypothetical protein
MNKKLLASLLLIAPLIAVAEDSPFPSAQKGIQIVPMAKQKIPKALKAEIMASAKEEKEKGYITTNDAKAHYLLNIKRDVPYQLATSKDKDYGVMDTRIKKSYTQIKLSFLFTPVKGVKKSDIIGYAAIGSFEKKGWNGIKEIFQSTLGNCSYSRMGIKAVQLAEETTEYFVNKKPSNKIIEGNINTGFLYSINWYTDTTMNTLECANMNFNQEIMTRMIGLANKIDKN